MVLDTGKYVPVVSGCHEVILGVTMCVLHQTPQGLHPEPYYGILYFVGDYIYEAGWNP